MSARPNPAVDWSLIESDYRAGVKPLREIGDEHGVSHTAVKKRAVRGGWSRGHPPGDEPQADRSVPLSSADPFARAGFVYVIFIECSDGRFYKIGMATHLDSRMQSHRSSSPFVVSVAIAYFVGDMRAEERLLHAKFADSNVRGEWFRLSQEDLQAVARRALLV